MRCAPATRTAAPGKARSRRRPRGRRRSPAILVAVVLGLALAGAAAADGIRVQVEPRTVTVGEPFLLQVVVEGSQLARPALPALPGCQIRERGSAREMSFVGGRLLSRVTYSYEVVPLRTGAVTLAPLEAEIGGEVYRSDPVEIRVVEPEEVAETGADDLFLTAEVSNPTPWLGEQVIYTLRFHHRARVIDARLDRAELAGFVSEELGEPRKGRAVVGGREYAVTEVRTALFPRQAGMLTIPGPTLSCEVLEGRAPGRASGGGLDSLFQRPRSRTRVLRAPTVDLAVRALPAPPPGFSGLIGHFELGADLSRPRLELGESTTLRLTVGGRGNVQMIPEPEMGDLGAAFKVYDEPADGQVERGEDGLRGHREFVKALVPTVAGALEIPAAHLVWFEPASGEYRTSSTAPLTVEVAPVSDGALERGEESGEKVAVRVLADGLRPPRREVGELLAAPAAGWPLLLAFALPPVACLLLWGLDRRRRRFAHDTALARRRGALRSARACLRQVAELGPERRVRAAELASGCLRRMVGDKVDLEGGALTAVEAHRCLVAAGVAEELAAQVRELLEDLEAARYGAGAAADPAELTERLAPLLRELDRSLP